MLLASKFSYRVPVFCRNSHLEWLKMAYICVTPDNHWQTNWQPYVILTILQILPAESSDTTLHHATITRLTDNLTPSERPSIQNHLTPSYTTQQPCTQRPDIIWKPCSMVAQTIFIIIWKQTAVFDITQDTSPRSKGQTFISDSLILDADSCFVLFLYLILPRKRMEKWLRTI
jgi:hypothetical protein